MTAKQKMILAMNGLVYEHPEPVTFVLDETTRAHRFASFIDWAAPLCNELATFLAENEEGFLRESDGLKTALVILHCRDYPEFQKILENSGWKTGENGDVIHEEGHLYLFGNKSGKNIFSAYLIRKK